MQYCFMMRLDVLFAIFITAGFIRGGSGDMNGVLTSGGVCIGNCDITSKDLFAYESLGLIRHPTEPDTATLRKKDKLWQDYFFFGDDDVFRYCATPKKKFLRCGQPGMTSTIFQKKTYSERFNGFLVKDELTCLSPCQLEPLKGSEPKHVLRCPVNWDLFEDLYECSVEFNLATFSPNYLQLSASGVVVARVAKADSEWTCLSLADGDRGWVENKCQTTEGKFDLNGNPCTSECDNVIDGKLNCQLSSGMNSACHINLKIESPFHQCRDWLERNPIPGKALEGGEPSEYCIGPDLIVHAQDISMLNIRQLTRDFTCRRNETARYVTLMAKNRITLDTNFDVVGGIGRRFIQLTIIAKIIDVRYGGTHIDVRGPTPNYHGYGDWANGGPGGNFLAIALEWKNPQQLNITTSGGSGACRIVPMATVETPMAFTNSHGQQFDKVKFAHSEFSYRSSGRYSNFYPFLCDLECQAFDVYGILKYTMGEPGTPGRSATLGINAIKSEQPTVISETGHIPNCDKPVRPEINCAYVMYKPNATWLLDKLFEIEVKERMHNESYFYSIRKWLTELNSDWSDEEILSIAKLIDEAQTTFDLDSPKMFYHEIKYIISNSRQINNSLELELTKSLKNRIANFKGKEDEDLLAWDYAATASHARRVRGQDALVLDIQQYIQVKRREVTGIVNNEARKSLIENLSNQYNMETDEKIKEIQGLIKERVLPEVKILHGNLEAQLKLVRKQIQDQIDQGQQKIKEYNENVAKLTTRQYKDIFYNYVKAVSGVAKLIPVAGPFISAGLKGGAKFAQAVTHRATEPTSNQKFSSSVPKKFLQGELGPISNWMTKRYFKLIGRLEDVIAQFQNLPELEKFINSVKSSLTSLRATNPATNRHVTRQDQLTKTMEVEKLLRSELRNLKGVRLSTKSGIGRAGELDLGGPVESAFEGYTDMYKDYFKTKDEIDMNLKGIQEVSNAVRGLREFDADFHNNVMPMVLDVTNSFDLATQALNVTSGAEIEVAAWEIQSNLKDITFRLSTLLAQFDAGNELQFTMNKISTTIDLLANLFTKISEAKEEKRLSNLIAGIAVSSSTDPIIEEFMKNLDQAMLESIIYAETERAMIAYRQWSFPFASVYLDIFEELPYAVENVNTNMSLTRARTTFENMHNELERDGYALNRAHRHTIETYFERTALTEPFFTWEFNVHNASILKLLGGGKEFVYFFADPNLYMKNAKNKGKEAIKFKTIEFKFHVVNNEEKQKQIEMELQNCRRHSLHLGYSYYNFQKKVYLFSGESVPFLSAVNETLLANERYANGTPVLSPYGMWGFKIEPRIPEFKLEGLITSESDVVNLELVGIGKYVNSYTDDNIQTHYEEFEVKNRSESEDGNDDGDENEDDDGDEDDDDESADQE